MVLIPEYVAIKKYFYKNVDLIHYSALAFDDLKEMYDKYWNNVQILFKKST